MTQPQTDYHSQPQTDYLSTAGPYNYEQPLPSVARTNGVTQVPPAKKITFYKSGDPQFGGVKMAINQRSFKSVNALMDDLSHRVPLPFGVRTITTPRGIHCINTLDQLEDGGCYLCSDKKYGTPISFGAPSRKVGPPRNSRPTSALRRAAQEAKREDYAATLAQQSPRIPKKITLVKNGDISTRRPIILNRRNARSFKTLLDEISEIMQFTVKKLYTVDGKRIDSMQALLHCPAVLVCVGREPFKPIMTESSRKPSSEKLPGLASRSNSNNVGENSEMNFGLKAKKSVIHPRSSLSNRSTRFSLSSEKSFPNGLTTSPENGAASSNNCAHSKAGDLAHTLVNDDIEKKVHVNKDGSLSVEMKVRFRLLNDETLQWSTHIKKSSLMNRMPCEELGMEEDTGLDPIEKMNPEASSEAEESLYPCDADSYISKLDESEIEEAHCHNCGRQRKDYDIWKNPMHASQKEEPGIRNTWYTHSSCSSTSSQRRIIRKKITSFTDSIHTSSSGEEYSEHIVRESSSYSETVKNRLDGRAVKKCCCQTDRTQPNISQRGPPEEPEAAACLTSSQNEDEEDAVEASMVAGEDGKGKGSKAGSCRSRHSRCSIDSQTKACEESSTVVRSLSSCSVKKTEDLEDVAGCESIANSPCSTPRAKDEPEETSENEQGVPSFSTGDCPEKEATEDEAGKAEEGMGETNSLSENIVTQQSIKDEANDCERHSTGKSFHHQTSKGMRSDSDEVQACSVASSSSRISRKSKHSHNHPEADSKASSKGSSTTAKKKKAKSSLHAEDVRSNSTMSQCSRGSRELERMATEGHGSHDSNPHLSEVEPPSATKDGSTGNISKRYSKSGRSSKKESQPEATSSPRSSFSESNEKNRDGTTNISAQLPSSGAGSVSESTCSKCGHVATARNDDHQSVNSRISSHSGTKTKCIEAEKSEDAHSQSSVAQSSKPRQKKMNSLQTEAENSSFASVSDSASVYSLHCPAPPKGRPSNRKRRALVLKKSSKSASGCTEPEPTADKEHKEVSDSCRLASSMSKSLETDPAMAEENNSETLKEEMESHQEKDQEEETEAAVDGGEEMIPSSLPNSTPEEVVHEWLRKIPSETLLMKYEMDDDGEEGTALSAEIPSSSNHQECLEGDEKKDNPEELGDTPAIDAVEDGAEEQAEEATEDFSEKASKAMSEKAEADQEECNQSATCGQNSPPRNLPSTIQTSVQIMKALLATKQEAKLDRSHSMPEVSPTLGRKLSNSAKILITCLASLQLLDEELDPPDRSKPSSRPRYTELLNIFQTLWFGCASESGGPSTEHQGEEQEKVASGIKDHSSKHGNFAAMSSSGVDVSSGDGGSREGSVAGAQNRALSPEEIEEAEHTEEEEEIEGHSENIHSKSFLEEEEAGAGEGEQEGSSRPPTACSKPGVREMAESSRMEEVAEAQDNQGSECEMGEEKENAREEEQKESSSKNENEECTEIDAEAHPDQEGLDEKPERGNSPSHEEADGATEQPSKDETESEPNAGEANRERVQESSAEKQLVDKQPADGERSNRVTHQATVTTSPATHNRFIDPDPVWVLKLLKKIEKEFMTHYVSAMNDFKRKWNLESNEELEVMIAELKEEVSKRIQRSIEKELRKIQSRAGKRVPRPPNDELRQESTQQMEGRRRRLQSLQRTSLISGSQSKQPEMRKLSRDPDEMDFFFNTTIKDDVSDLLSDDEYCPCDSCLRKKMSSKAAMNTRVVTSSAPVVKAFDLQKILQMKKDNGTENTEPDDITEELQDEKEVPLEPAEEEPGEHKENPATELSEERNPEETHEQEEVNEEETEIIIHEVEAEGEEASNAGTENEAKTEEEAKEEDDEVEQREEEEDVKEEGEEKEEEVMEEIREEEDVKEEEEEIEEEMKDDKEEEDTEEKSEEEEEEVEEQKEEEEEKEEEEQKEGEEAIGEEEKGEEDMKDEEAVKEEEEVTENRGEAEMEEEEENQEGKNIEMEYEEKEEEEKSAKEEVDEMEEIVEEEKEEDINVEEGEIEEIEEIIENVKAENEEKSEEEEQVEEVQDEKEEEDVKDEIKEEEEDKKEEEGYGVVMEVVMEEEEETKDETLEEEVDVKEEADENEEEAEEKVEENDVKEDEEKEVEEETKEEEMEEEETKEEEVTPDEGSQALDCAESIADAEEGAEEENDAEDDTEAIDRQEAEEEAISETGCETYPEKAEIEAGSYDAGEAEEEAEGEESFEPVQNDDEKTSKADDEEIIEGVEPPRSASAFSYSSSVGKCSQQSQKGSEERSDGDDCNEEENVDINDNVDEVAENDTKSIPAKMYPESIEEEEEEEEGHAFSQESTMKGEEAKTSKNKEEGGRTSLKQGNSNETIDADDLDF
ncbi:retinitis pigmentosa 1-like 1 protein [Paroedura picta]|uniref:retinitis pigmentosa 1-like 1 protein n=1 Tax=Paroedura picta TaxID=143630 RepID=UPI0040561533